MSFLSAFVESKAIQRLSGDQRGLPTTEPPKEVNWTGSRPLLSQVQISIDPPREEANATFFPSGEYCGSNSTSVEAMNFSAGALRSREFGPAMRQMLKYRINLS
jgi:hypothetical protein